VKIKSVGAGGGWLQGGGHGPVSVVYGLGVENVLELEVVTPTGDIVKVNLDSYPDLFWALRGGGASTYGVITRVTYRAYPQPPIVPVSLTFGPPLTQTGVDYDSYYRALSWFYSIAPTFNDFGIGGYPVAAKIGYAGPFVAANRSVHEVKAFLDPIGEHMKDAWNISFNYTLFPERLMDELFWPPDAPTSLQEPAGRFWVPMVSRLLSRSAMTSSKLPAIYKFVKYTLEDGAMHMAYPNIPGASKHSRKWDVSLNPAWRTASQHFIVTHWSWNSMQDIRNLYDRMARRYIPLLDEFSQDHASYINEVSLNISTLTL
jgi:FAD binding domain